MNSILKILIGALLVVAAGLYLHQAYLKGQSRAAVSVPTVKVSSPNLNLVSDSGYVELSGTAIMDSSSGLPAVPFIKYTDPARGIVTKQLIFADSRGCLPNAGDIPCVPTYAPQSAYPKLTTGEPIHVKGYIREDRLIVISITAS